MTLKVKKYHHHRKRDSRPKAYIKKELPPISHRPEAIQNSSLNISFYKDKYKKNSLNPLLLNIKKWTEHLYYNSLISNVP